MTATRIKVPRTALETVGLECCGQLMERDGDVVLEWDEECGASE